MLLRQRSEVATLKAELEAYAGRVQTDDGGAAMASAAPGPSGALRFADAPTSDKPTSGGAVDTPEPQGYYYTQLKGAAG